MTDNVHLDILLKAIKTLGTLNAELVYTGGAIISTFLDEAEYITLRETRDVDCIVQACTRSEYERVSERLRKLDFREDSSSKILCRFISKDLTLDLMPTSQKALGFTNRWFEEGFSNRILRNIDTVKFSTLTAPFFIATKIEAFKSRGRGDYLASHDIEDIITMFDGCSTLPKQIQSAPTSVKIFLGHEIEGLLKNKLFKESVEANISDRQNFEARSTLVLKRMKRSIPSKENL